MESPLTFLEYVKKMKLNNEIKTEGEVMGRLRYPHPTLSTN